MSGHPNRHDPEMQSRMEQEMAKVLAEKQERTKELACINQTTNILKQGKPIEESLKQIVLIIPLAWQYPDFAGARITFNKQVFLSPNFSETRWIQSQKFSSIGDEEGEIEVCYTREFPEMDEGPFLKEERDLINTLANIIAGYINSYRAREIIQQTRPQPFDKEELLKEEQEPTSSRQLLQQFLDKHNASRDIFHDLMPFKVHEILLVATLYDAYSIEGEGRFSDHILGEYHQLNLTSMPRVIGVSSQDEAFERLKYKHFDLIIVMMGMDKKTPLKTACRIKEIYPYIPVFLLLNNNRDYEYLENKTEYLKAVDHVYVWNGDSKVFFAMVKLLEDKVNADNDTRIGLTRVILLVEDSPMYYSRYLPLLYSVVLEQTQRIIEDVSTDDLYKVLKLRARPKILLASTYEEALRIFTKYKEYLLCVISDVRFPRNGKLDEMAGVDFIRFVKNEISNLPAVLQSSDPENAELAHRLKAVFIDKNSESLIQELKSFINYHLGFGHFVYRDQQGKQIAVAKSMREFEQYLRTVPEESLVYHGVKNHFSLWLMARGEIQIAKIINPLKITDFNSPEELREFLIKIIHKYRNEKEKGKIVNFDETAVLDESNIVNFAGGSLGGKGRGLAFINTLIYHFGFSRLTPNIRIRTPRTSIIGTDEFDIFMERNHLYDVVYHETDYDRIRQAFLNADISYNLEKKLKIFLKLITHPLAIRSSSLFEDSLMQPFSGVFETYLLPNNHPDFEERYRQAVHAIKLVYASIYSNDARTYFKAINHKIEEEKMAIVMQEVVGNQYGEAYYPHISGTAQSYNYYPIAHMKPEEGLAIAAVGLGQYVVEGERAYRFSPSYPRLDILTPEELHKNTQVRFYAVNMGKKKIDPLEGEDAGLVCLDISEAEKQGTLKHVASVYDPVNDRLEPGLDANGPRVINFANILKYDYVPLANTIKVILDVVQEALGSPVEIEYAVDLEKDEDGLASFYLLQIKPMVGSRTDYAVDIDQIPRKDILLFSQQSMGNGLINNIQDVIYVEPGMFDKTKTREMTHEIEKINAAMLDQGRKYILIGPGRWGTRDPFIGIPVVWSQISNAGVIVEMSMEEFPLDASLGSHFFHNVTSMNVGYLSVNHKSPGDFINWDIIGEQELIEKKKYFRHVRFARPLQVKMDGKKSIAVITLNHVDNRKND